MADYTAWLTAWGIQADASSSFRRLDTDRDGYLDLPLVTTYVREFNFSNDLEAIGNYFYGLFASEPYL